MKETSAVGSLSSEYRSTYRWHDYTEPKSEIVRKQPDNCYSGHALEPALPRRKKHPELAYRSHEFLSSSGSEALLGSSYLHDRARSEERWASSHNKNSRRSKSEGPHAGKSSYRLISSKPINIPTRSSTFATNPGSYFREDTKVSVSTRAIRQTELPSRTKREAVTEINTRQPVSNPWIDDKMASQNSPGKSSSAMHTNKEVSNSHETVPVHRKTADFKNRIDQDRTDSENNSMENVGSKYHDDADGELKSEYKKNFQPFNRYDYDEQKGVFEKRSTPMSACGNSETDSKSLSSWYREVILLRQKANQYRHRGWGTELIPEHMAQLYNDQMLVWEQVSRRSTLSALSLATTVTSRNQSPSKEGKENRKGSPMKSLTRAKSAKGSAQVTATHQGKTDKKKSSTGGKQQADNSPKKGNNHVKKLEVKRTSPSRTSREPGVGAPPTLPRAVNQSSEKPKRRPRPSKEPYKFL
ncbi:hypothetical protein RUM43_011840 [Polyplax serrata]|uniref:Nuclear protein MDM1 n=1 Tax=Polyplax serrata TaxID=468196 RepID=A0AAN8S6M3_POLSC